MAADADRRRETAPSRKQESAQQPLFRSEVIEERRSQWLGTVLLAPRISQAVFTVFGVATATALLALLFFAEYPRKARISGWLVPDRGLVRIFPPVPGVIAQLGVVEGSEVERGKPLLAISTEVQSQSLGATQEEIARRLATRKNSLIEERRLQEQLYALQANELTDRLAAIRAEQDNLERERDLQRVRVKLAEESEIRQRRLRERGIVSVDRLQQAIEQKLDQALNLRALERNWAAIQGERLELEGEIRNRPLQYRARLAEIDRDIAALEQQLAETEASRQIVILAPQTGTVTAIQAAVGGSVTTSTPLLSIVPAGSQLQAQLFSPSRAIGFVRVGQRVLLRYEAFPYQKFGHYEGVVASASRSAVSSSELTQQLFGTLSVGTANEPVYRITVTLQSQTATAYGEPVPLQPGMRLEADVVIESRRLIEWVLDPLYTLTGKLQG
jgi:membrane fusion protein